MTYTEHRLDFSSSGLRCTAYEAHNDFYESHFIHCFESTNFEELRYIYIGALTDATNSFLCVRHNGLEMCMEIKISIKNDVSHLIFIGDMYVFSSGL